jgi:hypothetical protein
MAAYAELLRRTKNDRLTFLLSQTDEYMGKIRALVKQRRREMGEGQEEGGNQGTETEDIVADSSEEVRLIYILLHPIPSYHSTSCHTIGQAAHHACGWRVEALSAARAPVDDQPVQREAEWHPRR